MIKEVVIETVAEVMMRNNVVMMVMSDLDQLMADEWRDGHEEWREVANWIY